MQQSLVPSTGAYPAVRLRRKRQAPWIRSLVAENALSASDLILPLFVIEGQDRQEAISMLPGVERLSIDLLIERATAAHELGIPAIALFPSIESSLKTDDGVEAFNSDSLICRAVRTLKAEVPALGIICDVALDPYTSHGHDGVVRDGYVHNDLTIESLVRQSLTLADAGCDVVAPSDMMDGRIGKIRAALEDDGFSETLILSYAAKYASCFYGPFRDAVGSSTPSGIIDKRSYQMDPANATEAVREVMLDVAEGADIVMIKPGLPYLDVLRDVSNTIPVPVFAYQVSGEYAMLMFGAAQGVFDKSRAVQESLIAFKRAGASAIFTYAALDVAADIKERS